MDAFTQMVPTTPAEPPNGSYKVEPHPIDGNWLQAIYPNGYGASVISGYFSYGGREGLYEIAVTHPTTLCYSTPITDDVIGWLNEEQVVATLHQIAALPRNNECLHSHIEYLEDGENDGN